MTIKLTDMHRTSYAFKSQNVEKRKKYFNLKDCFQMFLKKVDNLPTSW